MASLHAGLYAGEASEVTGDWDDLVPYGSVVDEIGEDWLSLPPGPSNRTMWRKGRWRKPRDGGTGEAGEEADAVGAEGEDCLRESEG